MYVFLLQTYLSKKEENVMLKRLGISVLTGMLVLSAAGTVLADDTVKIGLVTAVTGANSLVGEESQEGAMLAINQINEAGGVNGQKLELVVADEVDNLEMSVLAVQELLTNDDIMGIIGSMYSSYCIAAIPSVNDAEVPFISLGSSSGVSKEKSPYTWQVRPLDTAQGTVFANYIVDELGCSKPAVMYSTQGTYLSLEEQIADALAGKGVELPESSLFAFPEEEVNYAPYISQIMDGDFDCVIALANQSPAALICKQAEAAGLDPASMPLIGNTSFCSNICITNAGSAANGWYTIADWAPGGSNDTAAAYEEAYTTAYPEREFSDMASVGAYDAVCVLAKAMEIAGTNTDRKAINEAMEQIDMEACISYFKYNEDHSFATSLSVTLTEDGAPKAMKAISYR